MASHKQLSQRPVGAKTLPSHRDAHQGLLYGSSQKGLEPLRQSPLPMMRFDLSFSLH